MCFAHAIGNVAHRPSRDVHTGRFVQNTGATVAKRRFPEASFVSVSCVQENGSFLS
jgi:hypothetical protein